MQQLLHEKAMSYDPWNNDPWRILVVCIILNATKEDKAVPVLKDFFKKFPNANRCRFAKLEDLEVLLQPVGAASTKAKRLWSMSREFVVYKFYNDNSPVGFPVSNQDGCGQYAQDAWDLLFMKKLDQPFKNKTLEARRLELLHG